MATGEGSVAVGHALPGRGAWLCDDSPACVDRALRRGGLGKALRVRIDPDAARAALGNRPGA